ncbi:thiamine-phosphate kinase [Haloglomus litoreum]|uniref:thiamine-phosphate kinase n=1 Tax=Haloglomus litoreum TaxID=3034026 RepID=UPI0023E7A26A|nr:thiamine-phosphate kinase [Haloglomus sp. DT116]
MDERAALALIAESLPAAGDDAAVVDGQVLTTDMLHETTDFPDGTTRYTAGWRAVAASLSDVAAMGAAATAAVAVYGAPDFRPDEVRDFVRGAREVCEAVGAEYVGGDLDGHDEFTVATTALGRLGDEGPIRRSGAQVGDALCVTGELGRSAAALRLFPDEPERANDLFRFVPRVAAGRALAPRATAMMDSSDGLARSCHQLAETSECGIELDGDALPVHDAVAEVADGPKDERELAAFFGEDFELVVTVPEAALATAREACPVDLTRVGTVVEADAGLTMDGDPLPDRGYTHGA